MDILALIFAIIALIMAFLPILVFISPLFAIISLILGIISLVKKQNGNNKGYGKALAAVIISVCSFWFLFIGYIFSFIALDGIDNNVKTEIVTYNNKNDKKYEFKKINKNNYKIIRNY